MIELGVLIVCACWYPHSLERNRRLGYDFGIYYGAGLLMPEGYRQLSHLIREPEQGWLYKDYVAVLFWPLAKWLPQRKAFLVWYIVLVASFVGMIAMIDFIPLKLLVALAGIYPMMLALELGQITPLLALACVNPWGAVAATLVKPYCFVFVVIHAAAAFL